MAPQPHLVIHRNEREAEDLAADRCSEEQPDVADVEVGHCPPGLVRRGVPELEEDRVDRVALVAILALELGRLR